MGEKLNFVAAINDGLDDAMEMAAGVFQAAEEQGWPGFLSEDRRIIKEVVESQKVKKQRIVLKISELKSSVSQLALNTVEIGEDVELKEKVIIIEKYLRILSLHPNNEEYSHQFKKFPNNYDIEDLKRELKILEQIFVEEGGELAELYDGIESEDKRRDENISFYAERFGDTLGLDRKEGIEINTDKLINPDGSMNQARKTYLKEKYGKK